MASGSARSRVLRAASERIVQRGVMEWWSNGALQRIPALYSITPTLRGSIPLLVRSIFILSRFVRDDVVLAALHPLNVTIAKQRVATFGSMIVILVGIVIDGSGSATVAVHDDPDLRGAYALAFEPEGGVFVHIAINGSIRLFDATGA